KFLGMNEDWNAPGWSFITGSQDPNIRRVAATNGWLTESTSLTLPFTQTRNEMLNLRANVEPSTDFKVQIDVKKEGTTSYQEIFRFDPIDERFEPLNPSRGGNYKISFLSINTAFDPSNDDTESAVFK